MPTEYFEARERALLGQRYETLYAAPSDSAARGVTVSALRTTPGMFAAKADMALEPSPFCKAAFVVREETFKPGRHPYHHAGVFYSQEPSAASAAPLLGVKPGMRVLDLCAGSGCIGLALASQAPQAHVVLGEFSDGALRICRQNTRRNALTGRVIPMTVNALERPDRALGEFHCIVSNPPYIPHGDIPGLDHSVKDYEPHLALDGGEDGLDFYRAISEKWKAALAPGGRLYFEVGIGQADAVLRIMRTQGFGDIQVVKDHNDIPRVVFGTLCGEVYSE